MDAIEGSSEGSGKKPQLFQFAARTPRFWKTAVTLCGDELRRVLRQIPRQDATGGDRPIAHSDRCSAARLSLDIPFYEGVVADFLYLSWRCCLQQIVEHIGFAWNFQLLSCHLRRSIEKVLTVNYQLGCL